MNPEERARILANNKSLRIIKNELDQLLERNGLTDEQYGNFIDLLPAESSLRNVASPAPSTQGVPLPNMSGLSLQDRQPQPSPAPVENPPPAYANPTPPPPPRNEEGPPELCRVVALYRYADADPRDCAFEPGDQISVLSYANAEWWSGKNLRTGQIGIFPQNYVRVEPSPSPAPASYYGNEKAQNQYNQQNQTYNEQGGGQNPYNSSVPPMAVANAPEQQQQAADPNKKGKMGEMGKKFGSKLGNAAIFGAGATMGADLVNSIF